jgi:hypothetical protein
MKPRPKEHIKLSLPVPPLSEETGQQNPRRQANKDGCLIVDL